MNPGAPQPARALFGATDPPPFQLDNSSGTAQCLVVADHAGNAIPASLDNLGLSPDLLNRHIALDIGTRSLASFLAQRLGATALLANYSRLVVDLNRRLDDPTAFATETDGVLIPGNQALSVPEKQRRIAAIYQPWHNAIHTLIDELLRRGSAPVMISIHSFTPTLAGRRRPWHIGILWDKQPEIALLLLARLRQNRDLIIGDNEPYSGRHKADYTIDHHAEGRGLPCACIEVRQDLIGDETGVERWGTLLSEVLSDILKTL